jgi:hypothetical protein
MSNEISMESGVSARTGEPFVLIRWGSERGQLTPAEAEAHGLAILSTAMAARLDAAIVAEMTDPAGLGVSRRTAAGFVYSLRKRTGRA